MINNEKKNKIISDIDIILDKIIISDIGLFNGLSGVNLFHYYFKSNNYEEKIYNNCVKICEGINNGFMYHTYCNGLGGIAWSLNFLINEGVLQKKNFNIVKYLIDPLKDMMINDIKNNNYDFLHGAIGNAIFLIKNMQKNNCYRTIIDFINILDIISIKNNDTIKWESITEGEKPIKGVNISLSHGMSSIIIFLTKAYERDILPEKTKELLTGAVNFILSCCNKYENFNCFFPKMIYDEPAYHTRMGWCYGDLGTIFALYKAAKALNNREVENLTIEFLLKTATRNDPQKEFVLDAALCHGATGIGQLFYRMYLNTKIQRFHEISKYWYNVAIDMAKFKDGYAGFKSWKGEGYGGWMNYYSLLEGITGIGLGLMTTCSDFDPKWDECLLLS